MKQENNDSVVITLVAILLGFLVVYSLRHEPIIQAFGNLVGYGIALIGILSIAAYFWDTIKIVGSVMLGLAIFMQGGRWLSEIDEALGLLFCALFVVALMIWAYKKMGAKDDLQA